MNAAPSLIITWILYIFMSVFPSIYLKYKEKRDIN